MSVLHAVWVEPLNPGDHHIAVIDADAQHVSVIHPADAAHLIHDLSLVLAELDPSEAVAGLRALADELETAERARSN